MDNLTQSIEAILFATSEEQSIAALAKRLAVSEEEIRRALSALEESLSGHGIMVVQTNEAVTLGTAPAQASLIESIRKEELSKELTKASAETLAIITYHNGATKSEVEFIRGVNASYSLRALLIRGLIEQKGSGRGTYYVPTLQMLQHFGVARTEDLPQYEETKNKIDSLIARVDKEKNE